MATAQIVLGEKVSFELDSIRMGKSFLSAYEKA